MQGKGAGAVNRVELESQVLCAALRQSFHLKDRIGAFTSVRELSHLFPDLLPPPEKDDDVSLSNKANFYGEIGVRPQTSANGVLAGYLRAVRLFLRTRKVQDSRVEYNRILNAGFILRKPRLRLSHDLVVSRRWLHEESRMAQIASQEVTQDQAEAVRFTKTPAVSIRESVAAVAAEQLPAPVLAIPSASGSLSPSQNYVAPPLPPPVGLPSPAVTPPHSVSPLPAVSPLPVHAQAGTTGSGEMPLILPEPRSRAEVPPVPSLPVHVSPPPPVVPPVPATVNDYWQKQQPEFSPENPDNQTPACPADFGLPAGTSSSRASTPDAAFPVLVENAPVVEVSSPDHAGAGRVITGEVELLPGVFTPAPPVRMDEVPIPAPYAAPPASVPAAAGSPASAVASGPGNGLHASATDGGFPPAAVRAQLAAYAPSPVVARERPGGRIGNQASFVFDESQLHRPQSAAKVVPMLIQLMEAAQFITAVEVQALMAQMEFAPNVPVEKLILNAGYLTPYEMASVKLGESLLQAGKITIAQFQVAIYDERTSGLRMAESLQVRGWLSTEVRNAIDEFHRKRI